MTSKIVFVLLIGCAVAFASPINNKAGDTGIEIVEGIAELLKTLFGKLLEKIGGAIHDTLQKAFDEISKRLDTEVYREAIAELQGILKKIYGSGEEPNVPEEDKKEVEAELEKVAAAFEQLVQAALEKIQNNSDEKVDATEFKKAVDNLKIVVDKIVA